MIKRIEEFVKHINSHPIELYGEFGLQHELAFYFRNNYDDIKVYLEYPTTKIFGRSNTKSFIKKEIDLYIINSKNQKFVIELKMPKSDSGTPNEMYRAIEDVKFLEQLKLNNIDGCYSILFTNDVAFYNAKRANSSIYNKFNGKQVKINSLSIFEMPVFLHKKGPINLNNEYTSEWSTYSDINKQDWKYYILEIK
jgi:hypothetical protein